MNNVKQTEHLLAEKAQSILEHQQELQSLKIRKEELQQEKPTAEKQQLSYEESLQFGKQVKEYENKLQNIEVHIQKITRELTALKKQAKKLLPVSNINVRVSTDEVPQHTFCIKHVNSDSASEDSFVVEELS